MWGVYHCLPTFFTRAYIWFTKYIIFSLEYGRTINTWWDIFLHKNPYERKYRVHPNEKRLYLTIRKFCFRRSFDLFFVKKEMPWSSCDGSFHLDQINFWMKSFPYNFSMWFSWIQFIFVVIERFHWICKDQNAYGYAVDRRFWCTDNTHHLVLILQVMASYCSTVPIS